MTFTLRELLGKQAAKFKATTPPPIEVAPEVCPTNKRRFKTKREAEDALHGENKRHARAMKSFRCHYCDGYHHGHRR